MKRMKFIPILVKVVKSSRPKYWYANRIGKVLEAVIVIINGKKTIRLAEDTHFHFTTDDVEIIEPESLRQEKVIFV